MGSAYFYGGWNAWQRSFTGENSAATSDPVTMPTYAKLVTAYADLWTSPGGITVTAGVPVRWYVNIESADRQTVAGDDNTIKIPALGLGKDEDSSTGGTAGTDYIFLENSGERHVLVFTPTEPGDIVFTNWKGSQGDGSKSNYIHIVVPECFRRRRRRTATNDGRGDNGGGE